ncbi:hypothetical protein HYPSUDRAFT_209198 [Hypholoma sublateritium FD-334 SS-4]|uniref:Uncharacterized protein n=1 Tax=Hypholoma sublateritium (strain FD-334 SS-4) TaxID=945553 RepID=A0A0D2NZK3_HYPSF|nr:hypothetical protein HYPSUDRAFT_209198 [Hypholoma sublateritium FD-334 SS-4]
MQLQTAPLVGAPIQTESSSSKLSKTQHIAAIVPLVGALVPLLIFSVIGALFICWRRRRRAAERTLHRFSNIPPDADTYPRREENNGPPAIDKTLFHRITHPRRKDPLRMARLGARGNRVARAIFTGAEPGAVHEERALQAQLAEENLVLRMRIREMEGLAIVRSSGRWGTATNSDAPPDYDEDGIEL